MAAFDWASLMEQSGGDFEILPVGSYAAQVAKAEATTSRNGKLMFKTTFQIIGGEHNGRTIINNIVLSPESPNAVRAFFINMQNLGISAEFLKASPAPEPPQIAAKMVGAQVMISVIHREYQGQQRDNVDRISKISAADKARLQAAATSVGPKSTVKAAAPTVSVPKVNPAPAAVPVADPMVPQASPAQESTVAIPAPVNPAPAEYPAPVAQPSAPAVPALPDFDIDI